MTAPISTSAPIPFFREASFRERELGWVSTALAETIARGSFVEGPLGAELERRIGAYCDVPEAIAVGNGSDALIMALRALGVGPGDEVIVPTFTFLASASAIVNVGAKPVFVDVHPSTYNVTADLVRGAITARTKAIMPVHLFAQMAPMAAIVQLAREAGIAVLEDSAEGIGMFQDGVHAGAHGDIGVLSFFPTKTLGGFGDGGMVITRRPELARRIRSMRSYGRAPDRSFEWSEIGINSRLDEVQAAVLLAKLDRLSARIARRNHLARSYDDGLVSFAPFLSKPSIVPGAIDAPVFYVYLVECEARDALVEHLASDGIGTEIYYPRPLHLQPPFRALGYEPGSLPAAERAAGRTVALPLYPDLDESDIERVVASIGRFVRARR